MNRLLLNRRRSVSRSQPKMKPAEPKKEEKKMEKVNKQDKQEQSDVGFIKGMFVRDSETGKKMAVKATPEVLNMFGGSFRVEETKDIPDNVMEIALSMNNK